MTEHASHGLSMKQWFGVGLAAAATTYLLLPKSGDLPMQRAAALASAPADTSMTYRWVEGMRMMIAAAPAGNAAQVTEATLDTNKQACGRVLFASRMPLGEIAATCTNGERYLVFSERTAGTVALNCTAAQDRFVKELC